MRIRYVGNRLGNVQTQHYQRQRLPRFTVDQVEEFESIFKFLNPKDRDILYLIFVAKKRQSAVEKIMGRSQPSLCYDIKRIRKRIQFIVYLQSVFDIFLDFIEDEDRLSKYDGDEVDVLSAMFYSTSLTETSRILDKPQIRIRYMFDKIIRKMERNNHWDVYEIFKAIRNNLNIVRRVYSPKSDTDDEDS